MKQSHKPPRYHHYQYRISKQEVITFVTLHRFQRFCMVNNNFKIKTRKLREENSNFHILPDIPFKKNERGETTDNHRLSYQSDAVHR